MSVYISFWEGSLSCSEARVLCEDAVSLMFLRGSLWPLDMWNYGNSSGWSSRTSKWAFFTGEQGVHFGLMFVWCSVGSPKNCLSNCYSPLEPRNTSLLGHQGLMTKRHPLWGLWMRAGFGKAVGEHRGWGLLASFSNTMGKRLVLQERRRMLWLLMLFDLSQGVDGCLNCSPMPALQGSRGFCVYWHLPVQSG